MRRDIGGGTKWIVWWCIVYTKVIPASNVVISHAQYAAE